ncbi:F0F1 ATP synthase subunit epsilon [Jiella avicenniae]|uniref:F0F1 ATP synthase subunit epsilon n=1 Tax=Jiella avicenniae TaxID=2907202 RepID=A0A9X1NY95_9HYPH|nr:F0F1 ATP synthase subunit epsilon [Jiella avicenniae]MCE7027737.1 F0F1 ATP synthase subunit epsilon [Jiella avicenniae]MCE7028779.1 F0F1 ATP synthase subunit epsilon [Jiella avicenniae]
MKLMIVAPLAVILDEEDVAAIRAEDASGSFGILPGHADFLTALGLSVVSWTSRDGGRHHCAVRRGVLTAERGDGGKGGRVTVATREAILGDDLSSLHETVLARFEADLEDERRERVEAKRLELAAIRQIMRHLGDGFRDGARG